MVIRTAEIKPLEEEYEKAGNQLVLFYGDDNSQKEQLLKYFMQDKKTFYYRARPASEKQQRMMMGAQITEQYHVAVQKYTYHEYFNRIKSGDASKLVLIIDEFQYIAKNDTSFIESIFKLKAKRLYPGPVLIILASSAFKWVESEGLELFNEGIKKINRKIRLSDMKFLELVRSFPEYSVSECVQAYGIIGGVSSYVNHWNSKKDVKHNICRLILSTNGVLFEEAQRVIGKDLRELSVYNTILCSMACGNHKLNDLYHDTEYSRAKISVYMKNLMSYGIVEKVRVFETGGWDNAQKGLYQIKNTFINFWFKFVYPHMSQLYRMTTEEFYETYIEKELDEYLNRYFIAVCREYLELMNLHGKLPMKAVKMGTWIGKQGNIDIVVQNAERQNIVAICNWSKDELTDTMCEELLTSMKQAKIKAEQYYLFSARSFDEAVQKRAKEKTEFILIDMKEL